MPETAVELAVRLAALADDALAAGPRSPETVARIETLRGHLRAFVLPRAASLDAPLLVLIFGPTGSGKSSLTNALAGMPASATGVLRPTTRRAVLVATAGDRAALLAGPLAGLSADEIEWSEATWRDGVAIVDSPDIDSVETANRELADRLIEAADVAVFTTTGTRYADRVPWNVLRRAGERRLPLLVAVNRLPPQPGAAAVVLADLERLLGRSSVAGADAGAPALVPVDEGQLDSSGMALDAAAVAPIAERLERLRNDGVARRALAARALAGAIAGLEPLALDVADDLERDAIVADAARRAAENGYRTELAALRAETHGGGFLRQEVLRRWQDYIGADTLTRSLSRGMARLESSVRGVLRRRQDPRVLLVREEALGELVSLAEAHASEAARLAAAAWTGLPSAALLLDRDPALWAPSADLQARLRSSVDAWLEEIDRQLVAVAAPKRRLARGAATGVNAAGVAVMLAVFLHTGGLTGAEVGVSAAAALVNQRLLEAIFGEAAITRLVEDAERRLDDLLRAAFDAEAARFTGLVPEPAELRRLAAGFREAGAQARPVHDELVAAAGTPATVPSPVAAAGPPQERVGRGRDATPREGLLGLIRRVVAGERRGNA